MRGITALLVVCAVCGADESRLDWTVESVTVREAAARIAGHFDLEIDVGFDVSEKQVALDLEKASGPQALRSLRDAANGKLERIEPGHYLIGTDANRETRQALERDGLTIRKSTRVSRTARYLAAFGAPIVVDELVDDTSVALDLAPVRLEEAVGALATAAGRSWKVRSGVVCLATPERLEAYPERSPLLGLDLPTDPRAIQIRGRPLPEAVRHAARYYRLDVRIEDDVPTPQIHLYGTMPAVFALTAILVPHGCTAVRDGDAIVVKRKEP